MSEEETASPGRPVFDQADYKLSLERLSEAITVREYHLSLIQVCFYAKQAFDFIARFERDGSLCLACVRKFEKKERNEGTLWKCPECKLAISCDEQHETGLGECRAYATFIHASLCPIAEGKVIECFTREEYGKHVFEKMVGRIVKRDTPAPYFHRYRYHPYSRFDDEDSSTENDLICYSCEEPVLDFEKSFPCLYCNFGIFCSENCRSEGLLLNHAVGCVPRCFNPLCNLRATKMFCCTNALYCSSRCFHVDLQHDLSRHDCHPARQFVVFYHVPCDMANLAKRYICSLDQLEKCKPDMFDKPEDDAVCLFQSRVGARFFPFQYCFNRSVLGRLKKITNLDFLFTQEATWQFVYPYLCMWFYEGVVRHACSKDWIACLVFEDFFHMVTCDGFITLRLPEKKSSSFANIHIASLFCTKTEKGEKGCFCGVCKYKFHFDYLVWHLIFQGRKTAPLEGLSDFLRFYCVHYNCVAINFDHQIVHAFVSDRKTLFGHY